MFPVQNQQQSALFLCHVNFVSLENGKMAKGVGDATWSDVEASGRSREAMRMHRYTFSGYTGFWKD